MKTIVVEEYESLGEYFVNLGIRQITGFTFEQFCRRCEKDPNLLRVVEAYYQDMKQHPPRS